MFKKIYLTFHLGLHYPQIYYSEYHALLVLSWRILASLELLVSIFTGDPPAHVLPRFEYLL